MIVLIKQFGFVKWQVTFFSLEKHIALKFPSFVHQLLTRFEEAGIISHIKHPEKPHSPRIYIWFFAVRFFPENAGTVVHLPCDFRILTGAKKGTCSRVRIEQGEIHGRQRKTPLGILKLFRAVHKKRKLGLRAEGINAANRE